MLAIAILIYGSLQTTMMLRKGDTNISVKEFFIDRTNDYKIHTPFPKIQLSFILEKDGVDLIQQGGYVDVKVNQVEQVYLKNNITGIEQRDRTKTAISYEKCGGNFNSNDNQTKDNLNIANYYCLTNNSFTVGGSYYSPQFNYFEIRMNKCQASGSVTCKDAAEIDRALTAADIKIGITNSYVDLNDYNDPIKYYIDDTFYWETFSNLRLKIDAELQKNEGSFQDSLFQLYEPDSKEFFQMTKGKESLIPQDNTEEFFTFYIRTDQVRKIIDRKVYSIGDLIGQIGGIFEILHLGGAIITFLVAEKLSTAAIASTLYFVDKNDGTNNDTNKSGGKMSRKVHPKNSRFHQHNSIPGSHRDKSTDYNKSCRQDSNCITLDKFSADEESHEFEDAQKEISKRQRFKYTTKNATWFLLLFGWVKPCLAFFLPKYNPKLPKHEENYYLASDRISDELDVTKILKAMRDLKLLISVLLTRNQKLVLDIQKQSMIKPSKLDVLTVKVDQEADPVQEKHYDASSLIEGLNCDDSDRKINSEIYLNEVLKSMNLRSSNLDQKLYRSIFDEDVHNYDPKHVGNIETYTVNLQRRSDYDTLSDRSCSEHKNGHKTIVEETKEYCNLKAPSESNRKEGHRRDLRILSEEVKEAESMNDGYSTRKQNGIESPGFALSMKENNFFKKNTAVVKKKEQKVISHPLYKKAENQSLNHTLNPNRTPKRKIITTSPRDLTILRGENTGSLLREYENKVSKVLGSSYHSEHTQ
ncbi:unnamed protein product [Moneuplotes crassus]|uniref:Uncharacterized protein n=1 Tax=Euplotes crassus TaxID=5936 RepID=A0AAD1Y748_EUPCR|nr:unnamed protein product [Moneuplotes crassus]